MNGIEREGCHIAYRVSGNADRPAIVFSHSLGLDGQSWDAEATRFDEHYRVVRIDTRGHGQSDAPPGPYRLRDLCLDLLAVIDGLGIDRFHAVGLSLGGLVTQWLAVHRPERLRSATCANTAASLGTRALWQTRIAAVAGGMEAVVDQVLPRFFTPDFRDRQPAACARARKTLVATDPVGYAGCCAALRDADLRAEVSRIGAPTLIIGAAQDLATPPSEARWLHDQIRGSELVILEDAGHISNLERPSAFAAALTKHLER